MAKPTVKRLLSLLDETPIRLVEHAHCNGSEVAAHYDGETITLSRSFARSRNKTEYLVAGIIHELLHAADMKASEDTVLRWELSYYKTSRRLREECLVKLTNILLFGDE